MQKARVKYHLRNDISIYNFEGLCTYDEDKKEIAFKDKDETDVSLDLNNLILTRDNKEMHMVLNFNKGRSYINVKELSNTIELPLKINNINIKENKIVINYTLSSQDNFEFILEWILGGE